MLGTVELCSSQFSKCIEPTDCIANWWKSFTSFIAINRQARWAIFHPFIANILSIQGQCGLGNDMAKIKVAILWT